MLQGLHLSVSSTDAIKMSNIGSVGKGILTSTLDLDHHRCPFVIFELIQIPMLQVVTYFIYENIRGPIKECEVCFGKYVTLC